MKLPNFLCIGAAKCGTTTIFDILKQHNEVYTPSFKEPHFFDIESVYRNGLDWYQKTYFSKVSDEKIIADFTPSYLYEKNAPKRIFNSLGSGVKFIVLLRNPVDRAYSHYLHTKRDEYENLSFQQALLEESRRLEKAKESDDYLTELRLSYVKQGLYGRMLSNYFNYFQRENFLIIHFEEEFINKREETIKRILEFLSLDTTQKLNIHLRSNQASEARFKFIKRFMRRKGWWRETLKALIPSLKVRQIIKNRLQRLNIRSFTPKEIPVKHQKQIFEEYFEDDVIELEDLLNRKMNWDN